MAPEERLVGTVSGAVACDPSISPAAKAVYMVLAMHRLDDDSCSPSNAVLGRHTGLSEATVKRTLAELRNRGVIEREARYVEGRQTASVTRLKDVRR